MIEVEGFKAFRGVMRITPINPKFSMTSIFGDWLFKPEFNCWYCNGSSYAAEICEVVEDDTE